VIVVPALILSRRASRQQRRWPATALVELDQVGAVDVHVEVTERRAVLAPHQAEVDAARFLRQQVLTY
jgi:predicted metallo-beta-lactamase superfamily hydrolase